MPQYTPARSFCDVFLIRQRPRQYCLDISGSECLKVIINSAEFIDCRFVFWCGKGTQYLIFFNNGCRPPRTVRGLKSLLYLIWCNPPLLYGLDKRQETGIDRFRPASSPGTPGVEFAVTGLDGVGYLLHLWQSVLCSGKYFSYRTTSYGLKLADCLLHLFKRVQKIRR